MIADVAPHILNHPHKSKSTATTEITVPPPGYVRVANPGSCRESESI